MRHSTAKRILTSPRTIDNLNFTNAILDALPVDTRSTLRAVEREVKDFIFVHVLPTPVKDPKLVCVSTDALELLDLQVNEQELYENEEKGREFAEYLSGSRSLPGSRPIAHCYCGHQFGNFSGQLGDGAALLLGQITNSDKEVWELQLKGSGHTPFSRKSDGRKVLRSSIREFLCSEAMHYLGIPTTRCGSIVTSSTYVERDMFYNGNVVNEQVTIISRIAPTFLRFGSFEIFKATDPTTGRAGPSVGNNELLKKMMDYTLDHYFPECKATDKPVEVQYGKMFEEIVKRTASLVAKWQCVGFCHGVLNTDNMSIVGLTIDYGPYGFLDSMDLTHICNTSDHTGRYAFKEQPPICKWNLNKLAEAWAPFLPMEESQKMIEEYDRIYAHEYYGIMMKKLGLVNVFEELDASLIGSLTETMSRTRVDFTKFFRYLSRVKSEVKEGKDEALERIVGYCDNATLLKAVLQPSVDPRKLKAIMDVIEKNPMMIYHFGGDPEMLLSLIEKQRKFEEVESLSDEELKSRNEAMWKEWLGQYRERLRRDENVLGGSRGGATVEENIKKRIQIQNATNPKFILRNYICQAAIEKAEEGDFSLVRKLMEVIKDPFREDLVDPVGGGPRDVGVGVDDDTGVPLWGRTLKVSCSS